MKDKKDIGKIIVRDKVAQFTVVNPTGNNATVNLFDNVNQNFNHQYYPYIPLSNSSNAGDQQDFCVRNMNGNFVYTIHYALRTLTVWNISLNTFTQYDLTSTEVAVALKAGVYNPNNGYLYIGYQKDATTFGIVVINTANYTVVTYITLPLTGVNSGVAGIELDPVNNIIYYSVLSSVNVYSLNCATNTISGTVITAPQANLLNPVYVPSTQTIWWVGTNFIRIFNIVTQLFSSNITATGISGNLFYNSDNTRVYAVIVAASTLYGVLSTSITDIVSITNVTYITEAMTLPALDSQRAYMYLGTNAINSYRLVYDYVNNVFTSAWLSTSASRVQAFYYSNTLNTAYCIHGLKGSSLGYGNQVVPQAYIQEIDNYNMFLNQTQEEPAGVKLLIVVGSVNAQLNQLITYTVLDANGQQASKPYFPNLKISAYNFQNTIAEFRFKDYLMLDNGSYFQNYTINANSTARFILGYVSVTMAERLSAQSDIFRKFPKIRKMVKQQYKELGGLDCLKVVHC